MFFVVRATAIRRIHSALHHVGKQQQQYNFQQSNHRGFCSFIVDPKMGGMDNLNAFVCDKLAEIKVSASAPEASAEVLSACIGTHNGHFHCDEAFAVGMLQLTSTWGGKAVVRTRNLETLSKCGIVVDVGGTFDKDALRFDHHQRGFTETFSADKATKLSSAGLVYKYFGKEIIGTIAQACGAKPLSPELLDVIFKRVYDGFVEHIDGIDNGIESHTGDKNYNVSTHLSSRVGHLNPAWNEEANEATEMGSFAKAVRLTTLEFSQSVGSLLTGWLSAREVVEQGVKGRLQVDASGEILKIEQSCPWKSHIFNLESEGFDGLEPGNIKYVLYPDNSGGWRIQCVPMEEISFTNRRSIAPENLRGIRDDQLSDAWDIPGCIFVHASGFIGGNKTYQGVLEMARKSLK